MNSASRYQKNIGPEVLTLERLVKFEVLGNEYPLYTAAPEEEVQEILALVKSQLEACSPSKNALPSSKQAVLASLNMAGEYVKLKRDFDLYRKNIHEKEERLAKKIEESL